MRLHLFLAFIYRTDGRDPEDFRFGDSPTPAPLRRPWLHRPPADCDEYGKIYKTDEALF